MKVMADHEKDLLEIVFRMAVRRGVHPINPNRPTRPIRVLQVEVANWLPSVDASGTSRGATLATAKRMAGWADRSTTSQEPRLAQESTSGARRRGRRA